MIAGIPGQLGLYQIADYLVLYVKVGPDWMQSILTPAIPDDAWHLIEVQWENDPDVNGGAPMWYVNGGPASAAWTPLSIAPTGDPNRFNIAHDPYLLGTGDVEVYWQGSVRELELSEQCIWDGTGCASQT